MTEQAKPASGRWIVWSIVSIGALPWLLAWYLVNHPGLLGRPGNHGALIHPPRRVAYGLFQTVSELPARPLEEIRGRWVIIHVFPKACTSACQETLAATYKLHLLLNKDMPRVRRLAVWSDTAVLESETLKVVGKDKDLYCARVPESFLGWLVQEIVKGPLRGDQVMLMDPVGNLMMWYDSKFNPYGLYRDLRRLLSASSIG